MWAAGGQGEEGRAEARTCLQVGQPRLGQRDVVCEEGAVLAGDQGRVENMHLQQTTQQDISLQLFLTFKTGKSEN